MPFTGSTVPPFLRYGVSRFSLPNTRPLAANEKDPSASLGMTIREECVSHTLFLCMMHEISIPYTVISSAVEKSSLHSVLPCPFRGRLPILLCHTYDAIPVCKKDPSAPLGMTLREYRSLTLPIYFPCNNDTREAPSTFAALLFFMRRTTPLNPTT